MISILGLNPVCNHMVWRFSFGPIDRFICACGCPDQNFIVLGDTGVVIPYRPRMMVKLEGYVIKGLIKG